MDGHPLPLGYLVDEADGEIAVTVGPCFAGHTTLPPFSGILWAGSEPKGKGLAEKCSSRALGGPICHAYAKCLLCRRSILLLLHFPSLLLLKLLFLNVMELADWDMT